MSSKRKKLKSKSIRTIGGLVKLHYQQHEIDRRVKVIYNRILSNSPNIDGGNFTRFSTMDLKQLYQLYDHYFFNDFLTKNYGNRITFRLSNRMTKAGGKTAYWKQTETFEICLSTGLIFQTFGDITREVNINGIICRNRLEAVMRILEHEIIHLMELVSFGKSSCSKAQFKKFSRNIFNHAGVTHQLVTHAEKAYKKFNLKPGDNVAFDFNCRTCVGKIQRITKRATVMVKDPNGSYCDNIGTRYAKFYVPVQLLRTVPE